MRPAALGHYQPLILHPGEWLLTAKSSRSPGTKNPALGGAPCQRSVVAVTQRPVSGIVLEVTRGYLPELCFHDFDLSKLPEL